MMFDKILIQWCYYLVLVHRIGCILSRNSTWSVINRMLIWNAKNNFIFSTVPSPLNNYPPLPNQLNPSPFLHNLLPSTPFYFSRLSPFWLIIEYSSEADKIIFLKWLPLSQDQALLAVRFPTQWTANTVVHIWIQAAQDLLTTCLFVVMDNS